MSGRAPPVQGAVTARIAEALRRIAAADRSEIWIHRPPEAAVLADAQAVDQRVAAGEQLPLAGATLAVKDNIDVVGMPTTAGCPAFSYHPLGDASAVARLKGAGAIVLGKTNMDQFATGLVGTRSPYGPVRSALRPEYISGGSSSGSAVAVALGLADLGLGTDTAGSGRVPAAFQGIVGVKPTRGLIATDGVVPACRSLDCVSVFAQRWSLACDAAELMWGAPVDGGSPRTWPPNAPLAAPPAPRIAAPGPEQLGELSADGRRAFTAAAARIEELGGELVDVDLAPFLEAGLMLYDGAFVAERYAAVGRFVSAHAGEVDPIVGEIVLAAESIPAHVLITDTERLEALRGDAIASLRDIDALLLPTAPEQPTIAEAAGDPLAVNRRLGTYTNFCNLFDMCAVALPAGEADGGSFGVTLMAPAFHDRALRDLARWFTGETRPAGACPAPPGGPPADELFVVGAHLSGQPLNPELTRRGGRLLGPAQTAACYRLYRLATTPPKPGLVRVQSQTGARIAGELWALPPVALASLLSTLPSPMALGRVHLADGSTVVGFLCEPRALAECEEITRFGGWREYLAHAA